MAQIVPLPRITDAVLQKFEARVRRTDSCWVWTGPQNAYGYGRLCIDRFHFQAHRIAYLIATGEDPGAKLVDHICFNRACVNPAHLRTVTNKQNLEHRQGPGHGNSTGYRGVIMRRGRYLAQAKHFGVVHYAGWHDTAAEADVAARKLRAQLFSHDDLARIS